MRATFLLGPAGRGKTFRCLAGVRAALAADAEGLPLVYLAPKQATCQIERQVLSFPELAGYSRLQILSFDRLARLVLDQLGVAPPALVSAESRVMVLRALLMRHEAELTVFRRSAGRAGFALELSAALAELQEHQFTPERLRQLAGAGQARAELEGKLRDLALLLERYESWLAGRGLQDASQLLQTAIHHLRPGAGGQASPLRLAGLWLDGFAEMTPQELDLLAAVAACSQEATLAFCLEAPAAPAAGSAPLWTVMHDTYSRCRERLAALPGWVIREEWLGREGARHRFAGAPALNHLETAWARPVAWPGGEAPGPAIRVVECQNPEAEAAWVAREILSFVRGGQRYRHCAVLCRDLETAHAELASALRRHGIPFFLDRREPVAHHPLAELTRAALRLVAFDWRHEDWFAALKAGFGAAPEAAIDQLENLALEHGWQGAQWQEPLPEAAAEDLRRRLMPPFAAFQAALARTGRQPTGAQLADAFRALWQALEVEPTLDRWRVDGQQTARDHLRPPAIHATVFEQLHRWLDDLALAFPEDARRLTDWLPVLEAGLAGLTVGVIPPVLDEVLVGAVDRARNPALKLALVTGVNETVFPAPPACPALLTPFDRAELADRRVALGLDVWQQTARENYLGYIALTRADEGLRVSYTRQDGAGGALNPSPFIRRLQQLFPALPVEVAAGAGDWRAAQSPGELLAGLLAARQAAGATGAWPDAARFPRWQPLADRLAAMREPDPEERLTEAVAGQLYGPVLTTSVSRLEAFGQCGFRFLVHSGLRARERKVYELDPRERGSFQHEVLKQFHDELAGQEQHWREVTPAEASASIGRIAGELAPVYRQGLLQRDGRARFEAQAVTRDLQRFIHTLCGWLRSQYQFDPVRAEWSFGMRDAPAPAWRLELPGGRQLELGGKIDRIDVGRDGERTLVVVMDYKSSQRKLDPALVEHGIQLQLPAYLAALCSGPGAELGFGELTPAGVFYVNLRGSFEPADDRTAALAAAAATGATYPHTGRFDATWLDRLDHGARGGQFAYRLNQDGSLRKNQTEALPREEFRQWLGAVAGRLQTMGARIFAGEAAVNPYRKGAVSACDYCDYRPVCRLDPWTQEWRTLKPGKDNRAGSGERAG